eukprot:16849-Ditylum_brightwellii.AAC.1
MATTHRLRTAPSSTPPSPIVKTLTRALLGTAVILLAIYISNLESNDIEIAVSGRIEHKDDFGKQLENFGLGNGRAGGVGGGVGGVPSSELMKPMDPNKGSMMMNGGGGILEGESGDVGS